MRYLIFVFLLILLNSCFQRKENRIEPVERVDDVNHGTWLAENGFLDFADTSKFDSLRARLISSFDIYDDANGKIAHIDAEELAEFSFDFFITRLNKILDKRGFKLVVQTTNGYEKTHSIFINTKQIQLYTKEELESGDFWSAAARNFFKEINRQLAVAKIEESFYLLYDGNDLHVLLLTVKQHEVIAEYYKHNQREIPYLP
jgi:hypothetical protein